MPTEVIVSRLLIARHGETEANAEGRYMGHSDSPLTPGGLEQVNRLAERLAKTSMDVLYASDLPRAAQTAQMIGDRCGLSVRLDERLRERDIGILQGLTDEEARAEHPDVFRRLDSLSIDYAIPGGESASAFRARLASFLEDFTTSEDGGRVLLVAHGGVARCLLWHLLDIPYRASRWARSDNASVTAFVWKHSAWALERWNDAAHVDGDLIG